MSDLLGVGEARGRWVLAVTVLGSGLAMIDATVVNIALPTIADDLGAGTTGLTWVVNAYTLTLASLILLGGSLGDRLGRRRVFLVGVAWFAAASLLCTLAQSIEQLVAARALQGVGGALLTPGSLAILQASFRPEERSRAIGAWSGLGGLAAAAGPFLGGWLVGLGSWRWIFVVNVPLALLVLLVAARHVPESRDEGAARETDLLGALLVVVGLGSLTWSLSAWPARGLGSPEVGGLLVVAVAALVGFVARERSTAHPMLPLDVFASRNFTAANVVTFLVYGALGGIFFWLVVTLQVVAGFEPLLAGLGLLPVTVLMLLFSERAGVLNDRVGPRVLMTAGPLTSAAGIALLARIGPDSHYVPDVVGPMTVFAVGLVLTVTPLTATVLAAVPESRAGVASGVNNAVARTAGLLSVAVLPLLVGLGEGGFADAAALEPAFHRVALLCAGLLAAGGVIAWLLVRPRAAAEPCHEHCPDFHCAVDAPPLASTHD